MKKLIFAFMVVVSVSLLAEGGSSYTNYRIEHAYHLINEAKEISDGYVECLVEMAREYEKGEEIKVDVGDFLKDMEIHKELETEILENTDKAFFDKKANELEASRKNLEKYKKQLDI